MLLHWVRANSVPASPSRRTTYRLQGDNPAERVKTEASLDFDEAVVDPFEYLGKSEFSTRDRMHHKFESRGGIDCQVESVNKKKRVRGCKGYALVSVEKWVIVRQGFHKSCSFLGHIVVIAGLRAEYGGFQKTAVSNTIDPAVLIDLMLVDCENFGDGEVETFGHLAYFASF